MEMKLSGIGRVVLPPFTPRPTDVLCVGRVIMGKLRKPRMAIHVHIHIRVPFHVHVHFYVQFHVHVHAARH